MGLFQKHSVLTASYSCWPHLDMRFSRQIQLPPTIRQEKANVGQALESLVSISTLFPLIPRNPRIYLTLENKEDSKSPDYRMLFSCSWALVFWMAPKVLLQTLPLTTALRVRFPYDTGISWECCVWKNRPWPYMTWYSASALHSPEKCNSSLFPQPSKNTHLTYPGFS